jgi:hypothetical protein
VPESFKQSDPGLFSTVPLRLNASYNEKRIVAPDVRLLGTNPILLEKNTSSLVPLENKPNQSAWFGTSSISLQTRSSASIRLETEEKTNSTRKFSTLPITISSTISGETSNIRMVTSKPLRIRKSNEEE